MFLAYVCVSIVVTVVLTLLMKFKPEALSHVKFLDANFLDLFNEAPGMIIFIGCMWIPTALGIMLGALINLFDIVMKRVLR